MLSLGCFSFEYSLSAGKAALGGGGSAAWAVLPLGPPTRAN